MKDDKHTEPTIERCVHDRENPYVMISREMAQDKSISPKAKGVLLYLLSLPKDWKIYHSQLQDGLGIGEVYLNAALDELIAAGYADRTRERIKGVLQPYRYKIREFKKCSPDRVFQPGSSSLENQVLQSKDPTNQDKQIVCIADASGSDKPDKKPEPKEPQQIRSITKQNAWGKDVTIGWDELITYAVTHKKDWRMTEMQEVWKILQNRTGYVNDLLEFIAGTISNLRDKTRASYANKGKAKCSNSQTIKPESETKGSQDTSSSSSSNYSEKGTKETFLDVLKRMGVPPGTVLPPG